jgi:hypothetical protein
LEVIAARTLFFRDSDCRAKGLLRQGGFPRITFQKKIASEAMQEREP